MTALEAREHLAELEAERAVAVHTRLVDAESYMADLEEEIEATRAAYVGSAVVEIARLRAWLSGTLNG